MRGWLGLVAISGAVLWTGCVSHGGGEVIEREEDEQEPEVLEQLGRPRPSGTGVSSLGNACTANTDCTGTGAKCVTALGFLPIPGGYCSASCTNDRVCGTNGACPFAGAVGLAKAFLPDAGALADSFSVCVKKCSSAADCRTGYVCQALPQIPFILTNPSKLCIPPLGDGGAFPFPPFGDGGVPPFPIPDGGFRLPDGGLPRLPFPFPGLPTAPAAPAG